MAQGTGQATISFPVSAQAAQYSSAKITKDSAPNPNLPTTTWAAQTMQSASLWRSVAYGKGLYVAVSATAGTIAASSPDGVTWTPRTLPTSASWYTVVFGNGYFVAISTSSTAAAYSTDGINWVAATLPSVSTWFFMAYGDGKFVVISSNAQAGAVSTDNGATWSPSTLPAFNWNSVGYGNGQFIAVSTTGQNATAISTDGATWVSGGNLPASTSWQTITYGAGTWVALVLGSNVAALSKDGSVWVQFLMPAILSYTHVIYDGRYFIACASGTAIVAISGDGAAWSLGTLSASTTWQSVASDGIGNLLVISSTVTTSNGVINYNVRTISTVNTQIVPAFASPGAKSTSVAVTGLSTFTATDSVEAWIMGYDNTSSHNSFEHAFIPIRLRVTNPITGTGFTIQAASEYRLTGDFKVRYCFSS